MATFRAIPATGRALRMVFANLGSALRLCWPWLAILAVVRLVLVTSFPDGWLAELEGSGVQLGPIAAVDSVLGTVAFSSIAVNWHRHLLLGEQATGGQRLRMDWPVWRYLGNFLLIVLLLPLVFAAPIALISLGVIPVLAAAGDSPAVIIVMVSLAAALSLALIWSMVAIERLSIKLPAIALGNEGYGFASAWRDSSGSSFRLFGYLLMISFIAAFIGSVFIPMNAETHWSQTHGTILFQSLLGLLLLLATWISSLILISSLTVLYGVFGEGREI
jgi:hypothetical protein